MIGSRRSSLAAIALGGLVSGAAPVRAQTPLAGAPVTTVGVLIVAHGAGPAWNAPVDSLASLVRQRGRLTGPVAVTFLMGPEAATRPFQEAFADLVRAGARGVVVIPLLVSSHSGHYEQIRYLSGKTDTLEPEMAHHLHASGIQRPTIAIPVWLTPALDDSPELAQVVAARALALASAPAERGLFLLGHGPNSAEDYAAWMRDLRVVADTVRRATGFASVAVELVRDDAPPAVRAEAVLRARELIELQYAATRQDVVVVPLLVSSGDVSRVRLPRDLDGLRVRYTGQPLLPDTSLARWVERRVLTAIAATGADR